MNTVTVAITLVVYKVVLVAVGVWAERRTSDNADFFLGGRSLGPVVASVSFAASAASAWTLLGFSGATYALGVSAIWIVVGLCLACAISWFWVAPRMLDYSRERDLLTVPDFVVAGLPAGPWRRGLALVSASIILVTFLVYVASQFQGAGTTFTSIFGMNSTTAVVLGGAIVLIYTCLGGFWAVSLTDAIQGFLMLGAAVLLPIAAVRALGGWTEFVDAYATAATARQLSFTAGNAGLAAVGMVMGFAGVGLGMFGQPHLLARFMASRDHDSVKLGRLLATGWYVVVFVGIYIAALAGRVLYPDLPDPEQLFFALGKGLFHPIVASVLVAAVLSAIMSTADSMLLVSAAAVAHDLGLSRRSPARALWISRAVIAVLSVVAVAVALLVPASIFSRVLFAWTAIGAAFGPLVVTRLAGIRSSVTGVWLAVVGGFVLAVVTYVAPLSADWIERVVPFLFSLLALLTLRLR